MPVWLPKVKAMRGRIAHSESPPSDEPVPWRALRKVEVFSY